MELVKGGCQMAKVLTIPSQADEQVPLSIEAAVQEFLGRNWTRNTYRNYQADLRRFAQVFGGRPVNDIQPAEIQTYLNELVKANGEPVAASSNNRHFSSVQSLFTWLEKQEEVDSSPMRKVDRRKVPERLPRPMTDAQIDKFFSNIQNTRDRCLFHLLLHSGLRVSEALALNIEQLNLADGTFNIIGKGDIERIGYLGEKTIKLVRKYLRERGSPKSGPLFMSRQGRLSYSMANVLFKRYADEEDVTIHQFRHTFGSQRAGNMDMLILRDLMGHRSVRTTEIYSKVNPEAARKAFQEFDRKMT